jgi:hypothetical protein
MEHHALLMPALVGRFEDPSQRVQAHAAAALINFCEDISADDLAPYLNGLLQALFSRLRDGNRMVQEQVITAIAMVADSSKDQFLQFYDHFVPVLLHFVTTLTTKDDRFFRGRCMEALTLIGSAVPERFAVDAKALMNLLLELYKADHATEADDPFRSYVLSAWSRICSVLKEEFVPYLPIVLPVVLQVRRSGEASRWLRWHGHDQCAGRLRMIEHIHCSYSFFAAG